MTALRSNVAGSGMVTQVFRRGPFFISHPLSLLRLFVSTCFYNFLQYPGSALYPIRYMTVASVGLGYETECPITCLIKGAFKLLCLAGVVAFCGCILLPIVCLHARICFPLCAPCDLSPYVSPCFYAGWCSS